MVLAAGFGTRLRPYTLLRPKPLFPILNVPLLHILLDMLVKAGYDRVVVNCHHLADQIEAAVAARPEVILQHEPKILGTGGSLRKALPLFNDEPVLVMNGDIYHDIDLDALMAQHHAGECPVTMAMHDYERFNTVTVQDKRVKGFSDHDREDAKQLLAFTGIHILDRKVIEQIPANRFFHIIDLYEQLAKTAQVAIIRVDNHFWRDIGTPADYLALHRDLLNDRNDKQWCLDGQATVDDAVFTEWGAVAPGAVIGSGSKLTRCVVWENVCVSPGQCLTDMIVCTDID